MDVQGKRRLQKAMDVEAFRTLLDVGLTRAPHE